MCEDYLEHHFRLIDGKINISNIKNKKRGRKKGYKHDKETKEKIANKMRNRTKSTEERKRISDKLVGRKKNIETINKISRKKKETWPADDLLKDYTRPDRKEDKEWFYSNVGPEEMEQIRAWIEAHFEEFNTLADGFIRTYKDLKAASMKEQVEIYEQFKEIRE